MRKLIKYKIPLLFSSFGAFFSFVLFSYIVHKDKFVQLDFDITVKLQDAIPRKLDKIFSFLSDIGKFEPTLVFLLILLILRRKLWGIVAFAMFGFFHVFELFGKFFVDHKPPPEFMLRTERVIEMAQFHVRTENSYPSGHSGRAAFLAVFIAVWVFRSKKMPLWAKLLVYIFLIGYTGAMFISRPYLGEHWTTDVIGGALLGLSFGLLAALW